MFRMLVETSWTLDIISLRAFADSGDNFKIVITSSTVMIFKNNITNIREKAVEAKRTNIRREKNERRSIGNKILKERALLEWKVFAVLSLAR